LVRATDINTGKARIQENLANYQLWQKHFSERITPIIGDLSQPQLGLTDKQWQTLTEQVDIIYHNGALLNYVYPYELLKPTNVLGTRSILKLASLSKTKPVHYVSSTAVFDCHTTNRDRLIVKESDFIDRPEGMYLGYSQSKWVADQMMQTARDRGIPVCIYRSGFIGGHSQTGITNTEDIIWRMIRGSLQMGYLPEIELNLDLTPVDYVSQNIVALSKQNCLQETIFHLNHPQPLPWNQLVKFTQDIDSQVQFLSLEQWLEKLKLLVKPNPANPLYPLIPFFLNRPTDKLTILELMQSRKSPQVSCQETLKILAQVDRTLHCPTLDKNLWQTYFDYFNKKTYKLN
jgi:thioester reductase-like protein